MSLCGYCRLPVAPERLRYYGAHHQPYCTGCSRRDRQVVLQVRGGATPVASEVVAWFEVTSFPAGPTPVPRAVRAIFVRTRNLVDEHWRCVFRDVATHVSRAWRHIVSDTSCTIDRKFKALFAERPACQCRNCGTTFVPAFDSNRRKFCSGRCSDRFRKWKLSGNAMKRARIAGVARVNFDPLEVLERDRWICRICGIPTPQALRGTTAPDAPEVDHVVALSRGGIHAPSNCQCTCRRCNALKAAGPHPMVMTSPHNMDVVKRIDFETHSLIFHSSIRGGGVTLRRRKNPSPRA